MARNLREWGKRKDYKNRFPKAKIGWLNNLLPSRHSASELNQSKFIEYVKSLLEKKKNGCKFPTKVKSVRGKGMQEIKIFGKYIPVQYALCMHYYGIDKPDNLSCGNKLCCNYKHFLFDNEKSKKKDNFKKSKKVILKLFNESGKKIGKVRVDAI